ncbi:GNAT family N-acetyltransferase [Vallitalea pronyensis]|uniref:GNAT family N-acetyltransferase n=1 Tax=Vallitalea pronyensis TaxID=1348613 RepID=A0A8J8SIR6_9FIRM|nr:GNAT family N-acetyltransferase [Vallitalea pronyensis]QUI25210.1 GNAT family N-acetyltransferase [Vallitalea pronyensis]
MIELEELKKEDLPMMTEIAIKAFQDDKNTYGDYPPLIDMEHHTIRFIDNGLSFKILKKGQVIGGIMVFNHHNGTYTLGSIFIDPAYQNKGIGQQTIRLIEAKCPDATTWKLDTPYRSYRNHHVYEKMGYVKTGEVMPNKKNPEFKLFLYEKSM